MGGEGDAVRDDHTVGHSRCDVERPWTRVTGMLRRLPVAAQVLSMPCPTPYGPVRA